MNLFKKALVASAILASVGAHATATVSSTPIQMSAEGVADGLSAADVNLVFDIVVGTLHPAASTITLTFDANVDLDLLTGGAVVNTPANGTGVAGANTAGDSTVAFDYGTGSFTFDNVVVDTATAGAHTLSFDVNLGNPVTANSAFRLYLGDVTALGGGTAAVDTVDISGASVVAYSAVDSGGLSIENGSGTLAEEVAQFSVAVTTKYDQLIDRVDPTQFVDTTVVDAFQITLGNNEALEAALTAVTASVELDGNFTAVVVGDLDAEIATVDLVAAEVPTATEITLTLSAAEVVDAGNTVVDLGYAKVGGAIAIPVTGDIDVTVTLDYTNGTSTAFDLAVQNGGQWALDATIINVPYFPVGYAGTSTSVHFANESVTAADVIVTAIDNNGMTYGPLDLGMNLAGDTVTKVSQTAIMSLFGLTTETKLSVTFNIDADSDEISAYAYTQADGKGRSEISNSQMKYDGKRAN